MLGNLRGFKNIVKVQIGLDEVNKEKVAMSIAWPFGGHCSLIDVDQINIVVEI